MMSATAPAPAIATFDNDNKFKKNESNNYNFGKGIMNGISSSSGGTTHQFDHKIEKALEVVRSGSKNVHLNNMDINDEMMIPLCDELAKYKQLECIYLYVNRIGAQGIKKLVQLMKTLKSIKYLHLGGNQIGDEGLNEIASFIKDDKVLEHLAVGNVFSCYPEHGASISDDALINFANAVVGNTSLRILGLGGKKRVTNASVPALRHMLQNSCINQIDLTGSGMSANLQDELHKLADLPYEEREIGVALGLKKSDTFLPHETCSDSSVGEGKPAKDRHHHNKGKNRKLAEKKTESKNHDENEDDEDDNAEEEPKKNAKKQKRNPANVKKNQKKNQKVAKGKTPTRHSTRIKKSA